MPYSDLTAEELVQVCATSGDPEAWEEFVCRFEKIIYVSVRRVAYRWGETSESTIAELVQDTYLKFCADDRRLLHTFRSRHPDAFFGMLKVTAAHLAHDHFRAERNKKRSSGMEDCSLDDVELFIPDSGVMGQAGMERYILLEEVDDALKGCSERDREIFWLHYRHGFTAQEIASIACFKLETKGVESVLHRLTQLVRRTLVQARAPQDEEKGISEENTLKKGEGQP
jgi:RNA polymerase sigma-70 factor, ECF subfamily